MSRRLRRALATPTGMAAAIVIAAMLVLAVIGPIVWGSKAAAIDVPAALQGPSWQHLFGTDQIGRDIFSRTMAATRLSLELAVLSTLIAVGVGIPVGITQAVLGPRMRRTVAGVISAAVAFPGLLLALFVNTIIGIGATGAVLGIGIAMIPSFARLGQTLSASIAGLDYVAAARILGISRIRILFFHVLPNIAEPLTLTGTMSVGWSLLGISALSFLGLGVRPPSYDWGSLLGSGLQYVYENPLASLGPGALIVLAGLAFNLAGETLARVQGGPSVAGPGLEKARSPRRPARWRPLRRLACRWPPRPMAGLMPGLVPGSATSRTGRPLPETRTRTWCWRSATCRCSSRARPAPSPRCAVSASRSGPASGSASSASPAAGRA